MVTKESDYLIHMAEKQLKRLDKSLYSYEKNIVMEDDLIHSSIFDLSHEYNVFDFGFDSSENHVEKAKDYEERNGDFGNYHYNSSWSRDNVSRTSSKSQNSSNDNMKDWRHGLTLARQLYGRSSSIIINNSHINSKSVSPVYTRRKERVSSYWDYDGHKRTVKQTNGTLNQKDNNKSFTKTNSRYNHSDIRKYIRDKQKASTTNRLGDSKDVYNSKYASCQLDNTNRLSPSRTLPPRNATTGSAMAISSQAQIYRGHSKKIRKLLDDNGNRRSRSPIICKAKIQTNSDVPIEHLVSGPNKDLHYPDGKLSPTPSNKSRSSYLTAHGKQRQSYKAVFDELQDKGLLDFKDDKSDTNFISSYSKFRSNLNGTADSGFETGEWMRTTSPDIPSRVMERISQTSHFDSSKSENGENLRLLSLSRNPNSKKKYYDLLKEIYQERITAYDASSENEYERMDFDKETMEKLSNFTMNNLQNTSLANNKPPKVSRLRKSGLNQSISPTLGLSLLSDEKDRVSNSSSVNVYDIDSHNPDQLNLSADDQQFQSGAPLNKISSQQSRQMPQSNQPTSRGRKFKLKSRKPKQNPKQERNILTSSGDFNQSTLALELKKALIDAQQQLNMIKDNDSVEFLSEKISKAVQKYLQSRNKIEPLSRIQQTTTNSIATVSSEKTVSNSTKEKSPQRKFKREPISTECEATSLEMESKVQLHPMAISIEDGSPKFSNDNMRADQINAFDVHYYESKESESAHEKLKLEKLRLKSKKQSAKDLLEMTKQYQKELDKIEQMEIKVINKNKILEKTASSKSLPIVTKGEKFLKDSDCFKQTDDESPTNRGKFATETSNQYTHPNFYFSSPDQIEITVNQCQRPTTDMNRPISNMSSEPAVVQIDQTYTSTYQPNKQEPLTQSHTQHSLLKALDKKLSVASTSADINQKPVQEILALMKMKNRSSQKNTHNDDSDELTSQSVDLTTTLSDQSELEARLIALKRELERKKDMVEILKKRSKQLKREKIKQKEEVLQKQIEVFNNQIEKLENDISELVNSSSDEAVTINKDKDDDEDELSIMPDNFVVAETNERQIKKQKSEETDEDDDKTITESIQNLNCDDKTNEDNQKNFEFELEEFFMETDKVGSEEQVREESIDRIFETNKSFNEDFESIQPWNLKLKSTRENNSRISDIQELDKESEASAFDSLEPLESRAPSFDIESKKLSENCLVEINKTPVIQELDKESDSCSNSENVVLVESKETSSEIEPINPLIDVSCGTTKNSLEGMDKESQSSLVTDKMKFIGNIKEPSDSQELRNISENKTVVVCRKESEFSDNGSPMEIKETFGFASKNNSSGVKKNIVKEDSDKPSETSSKSYFEDLEILQSKDYSLDLEDKDEYKEKVIDSTPIIEELFKESEISKRSKEEENLKKEEEAEDGKTISEDIDSNNDKDSLENECEEDIEAFSNDFEEQDQALEEENKIFDKIYFKESENNSLFDQKCLDLIFDRNQHGDEQVTSQLDTNKVNNPENKADIVTYGASELLEDSCAFSKLDDDLVEEDEPPTVDKEHWKKIVQSTIQEVEREVIEETSDCEELQKQTQHADKIVLVPFVPPRNRHRQRTNSTEQSVSEVVIERFVEQLVEELIDDEARHFKPLLAGSESIVDVYEESTSFINDHDANLENHISVKITDDSEGLWSADDIQMSLDEEGWLGEGIALYNDSSLVPGVPSIDENNCQVNSTVLQMERVGSISPIDKKLLSERTQWLVPLTRQFVYPLLEIAIKHFYDEKVKSAPYQGSLQALCDARTRIPREFSLGVPVATESEILALRFDKNRSQSYLDKRVIFNYVYEIFCDIYQHEDLSNSHKPWVHPSIVMKKKSFTTWKNNIPPQNYELVKSIVINRCCELLDSKGLSLSVDEDSCHLNPLVSQPIGKMHTIAASLPLAAVQHINSAQSKLIKWCMAKQKDMVDIILIEDMRKEENQWIYYDEAEEEVKMQIGSDILSTLLDDTVIWLRDIVNSKDS